MRTSHKLTRILVTLFSLAMLAMAALADDPVNIGVSDQKAGSILVFPYYTAVGQNDTRISITNLGHSYGTAKVHVLLMDRGCSQLDYYTCITPNGSLVEKATQLDPANEGYIIAIAVDSQGKPTRQNALIGNAFVTAGDYVGNYGAEAWWWAGQNEQPAEYIDAAFTDNAKTDTATIKWKVPCEFAVEIQSPADAVQKLIVVGLTGNINTSSVSGATQVGTGLAYNEDERAASFVKFITGSCFDDHVITATNPRVPNTLASTAVTNPLMPSGVAGHLRFSIGGGVGLIMTSNKKPNGTAAPWSGIRTLHKTKTTEVTLVVPVFWVSC